MYLAGSSSWPQRRNCSQRPAHPYTAGLRSRLRTYALRPAARAGPDHGRATEPVRNAERMPLPDPLSLCQTGVRRGSADPRAARRLPRRMPLPALECLEGGVVDGHAQLAVVVRSPRPTRTGRGTASRSGQSTESSASATASPRENVRPSSRPRSNSGVLSPSSSSRVGCSLRTRLAPSFSSSCSATPHSRPARSPSPSFSAVLRESEDR